MGIGQGGCRANRGAIETSGHVVQGGSAEPADGSLGQDVFPAVELIGGVQVVDRDVVGEKAPAADLFIARVYAGDVGAVQAVLVLTIEVHAFTIIHRVAQDLAGVDLQALEAGWRCVLETSNRYRFTANAVAQYVDDGAAVDCCHSRLSPRRFGV